MHFKIHYLKQLSKYVNTKRFYHSFEIVFFFLNNKLIYQRMQLLIYLYYFV